MFEAADTRRSLLARLQQSDEGSWVEFAEIYQPAIYRLAVKKGLQHADALNVAQDVLAKVYQSIESWDPDASKGSFRGWLYRITSNTSINALKKLARSQGTGDTQVHDKLEQLPGREDQDASLFRAEYRRQLFRHAANTVRGEFSDTSWKAFWMTSVDGADAKGAAAELGMSVGAVYTARCRVWARIRQVATRLLADERE
jgi:RNA polymerase sigma factor (sigma-70 family)